MEPAQLSFIDLVTIKEAGPPKPPTPFELMALGLQRDTMELPERLARLRGENENQRKK